TAGRPDRIADSGGRGDALPEGGGIRYPIWAGELETECFADAGEPLSEAKKKQRMAGVEQRDKRPDVVDRLRFDGQGGHGTRCTDHPSRVPPVRGAGGSAEARRQLRIPRKPRRAFLSRLVG